MVKNNLMPSSRRAVATPFHLFRTALATLCMPLLALSSPLRADVFPGVSLRILNQTAPPGGVIQLTLVLTEPKPITSGSAVLAFDSGSLDSVLGVALFSAAGDVSGAAVVRGNQVKVQFTSPLGAFGTDIDTPILVASIAVRPDARRGDRANLILDPSSSLWLDPSGEPYPQEVRPGVFTVGGSVSITDVLPGGGVVPAGSTVTLKGMGFQPLANVQIDGVDIASTHFVSSTQLDVIVANETQLYGKRARVRNPDGFEARYYSYLRGAPIGRSDRPLLAATVPVFATETLPVAYFNPVVDDNLFLGLAFQNPNAASAGLTIEMYSAAGELIASTSVSLPPRARISREVSEFLPRVTPPAGSYLRVVSSLPVQMLGLLGNEAADSVVPVNPIPAP